MPPPRLLCHLHLIHVLRVQPTCTACTCTAVPQAVGGSSPAQLSSAVRRDMRQAQPPRMVATRTVDTAPEPAGGLPGSGCSGLFCSCHHVGSWEAWCLQRVLLLQDPAQF